MITDTDKKEKSRIEIAAEIYAVLKGWPRCDLSAYAKKNCKLCNGKGKAKYVMEQGRRVVERICNCIQVKLRISAKDRFVAETERKDEVDEG